MRESRGQRLVVGLVLAVVALAGCGGGGSEAPGRPSATGTGSVEVRTETFVDTGRSRTFETSIYVPGGAAAANPLVVFVHGSGGNPDFYRVMLEALAGSGYVVAAPRLPSAARHTVVSATIIGFFDRCRRRRPIG